MPRSHRESDSEVVLFCPGCVEVHVVTVGAGGWSFNGNHDAPTFSPSLLVRKGHDAEDGSAADCEICRRAAARGKRSICSRCHSFITDGRIQFLTDSTHALAGQTVDLPEWRGFDPDNYGAKS